MAPLATHPVQAITQRIALVGAALAVGALVAVGPEAALGVALGALVAVAHFLSTAWMGHRILSGRASRWLPAVYHAVKLAAVFAAAFLSLTVLGVPAAAFVVGLSAMLGGILWQALASRGARPLTPSAEALHG